MLPLAWRVERRGHETLFDKHDGDHAGDQEQRSRHAERAERAATGARAGQLRTIQ